jgi:glycosyltransferase involved in cell wall biosynthesis
MNKTVSIIIPTYNRPGYLSGAIETALNQAYNNVEIIVVDDGSEKEYSKDIISQYPDSIKLAINDTNKGLSATRNKGIRQSSGSYIAFLDDDDRWHRTKLAEQVKVLEQNPQAGLATCLVAAITPDNELVHCETKAPSGDCSDELLISNTIGTPSRILVRRSAIDDVGKFDESLPTKQDWDFYLRLCQSWEIAAVSEHLCFRTIHESMSSSPEAAKRDKEAILEKHEDLVRKHGRWEQARAAIDEEVGRSYLGNGELRTGRPFLRSSLSEPSLKRGLLFILSYTHPVIVNHAIELKRKISLQKSGCAEMSLTPEVIPGVNS